MMATAPGAATLDALTLSQAALIFACGWILGRLVAGALGRTLSAALSAQQLLLLRRGIVYTAVVLSLLAALRHVGVDLTVLMGAAGILTVAFGFASQTAASNIISGLFLVSERPFELGELIEIGATTGFVESIDPLSVKLRTLDNLYVRVPNEALLKAPVVNYSRNPIRRVDIQVPLPYESDTKELRALLLRCADGHRLCFTEPEPEVIFDAFGPSGVEYTLRAWALREHYLDVRTTLAERVHAALTAHGIAIGVPQRLLRSAPADPAQRALASLQDPPAP